VQQSRRAHREAAELKNASGNTVETCAILTTSSNAVTSPVHDRMPVILDPDSYDLWLDPGMKDVSAASGTISGPAQRPPAELTRHLALIKGNYAVHDDVFDTNRGTMRIVEHG
jgi:hypothetical protein